MTTTAETTGQRYDRLESEFHRLRCIVAADRTEADRTALQAVTAEFAALLEQPPPAYTLPASAADLISYALAHGWDGRAQWTPPGADPIWVTVHIGRHVTEADRAAADRAREYLGDGPLWHYQLTWHSRGCPPGRVRRFGGLAETPEHPATHDAPSLRAIREVIEQHPAPGRTS